MAAKAKLRVHTAHLMNADWAPGGCQCQPSLQASRLGHCYYDSAQKLVPILLSSSHYTTILWKRRSKVRTSFIVFIFLHSVANNNNNTSCCCVQSEADSDVSYRLSLYKDADYKHELSSFPAAVDDKQRLYIRASVTAGFSSSLTHTRLTALCPGLSRWADTRKVTPSGFYWSKRQWVAVASAGPYASLHLAADR